MTLYISTATFLVFSVGVILLGVLAMVKPNTYLRCGWKEYIFSICASYQFVTYPIHSFMYNGSYVGTLIHLIKGFKHYNVSIQIQSQVAI
jgi:hypothetical protein